MIASIRPASRHPAPGLLNEPVRKEHAYTVETHVPESVISIHPGCGHGLLLKQILKIHTHTPKQGVLL